MVRTLAAVFVALLAIAGAASADCPPNYVGQNLTTPSGTPIVATASRDSMCAQNFCNWKSQWDHALGTAHVEATAPFCGEGINASDVGQFTSDDYVLTGPGGPNPVTFQASLHVTGAASNGCHTLCDPFLGCHTTCSPGYVSASLRDGSQTSSTGQLANVNTDLVLTLSKQVGQHFHLDRGLYAHSFCGSNSVLSSQLQIVLPPGYGATSCYGYAASGPTGALHMSWGKVKSLYR